MKDGYVGNRLYHEAQNESKPDHPEPTGENISQKSSRNMGEVGGSTPKEDDIGSNPELAALSNPSFAAVSSKSVRQLFTLL